MLTKLKGETLMNDELREIEEIIFAMNSLILKLTIRREKLISRHGMRTIKQKTPAKLFYTNFIPTTTENHKKQGKTILYNICKLYVPT
jgi:hypothetical protein